MTYIMAYIAYGTTPVNSFRLTGQYEEGVAVELVGARDRRRTYLSTTETNDGEIPVLISSIARKQITV